MIFEYEVTEEMPFDIKYPKNYEEWIRKSLPAVMFYDRFKKVMHCTRCGHTGDYDYKIRKGDRVICPHCGEELSAMSHTTPRMASSSTFLHFWKTKKAIYFAEVLAVWKYEHKHTTTEEIKKAIYKDYSQTREQEELVKVFPLSIGRISRDRQQGWENRWSYNKGNSRYAMCEMKAPRLVDYSGWWKVHPNTERLLSKTFLGPDSFRHMGYPSLLIKELTLHAKYPGAEYIVKAGLGEYIDRTVEQWSRTYIRPNWKAKTLPGFLRIKAQDVDKLRKWDMLTVENIAYYKKALKWRAKPQLEDVKLMKRWLDIGSLYSGRIHGDPIKMARYFEKQWNKGRYRWDNSLIGEYMDYERMIDHLEYPAEDDYYRYPKDLKEAHDRATAEYNAKLEEERRQQAEKHRQQMLEKERLFIEEILPKLQRYNMQDDKYLIRALESVDEFKAEGVNNHNCVGSYADRAMKGNAKIFVLRKVDAPEVSFVTIELALDEKSIRQCYGRGNSLPDEEVKTWVDHWLKTVVNGKKKRRKKAA